MTTPTTTIRLPHELRQRLQQYAKAGNKTNTEVIVQALQTFLEQESAANRQALITKELERLSEIDKADPELAGFYDEPEVDPFGGRS